MGVTELVVVVELKKVRTNNNNNNNNNNNSRIRNIKIYTLCTFFLCTKENYRKMTI